MQALRTNRTATNVRKERTFKSGPYLNALFGGDPRAMDAYLEEQICQRIKQARKEAGFTQEEIAHLLDVGLRTYQNYEHDRVPFRLMTRIAELTQVREIWLLHGDPAGEVQAQAEQLLDVAEGVKQIELALARILPQIDAALGQLERIEAAVLPPGETRHAQH